MKSWDVIIVGGGIIGLSLAIELRKTGRTVLLVERGEPGKEASYAAGGMLANCGATFSEALKPLADASAMMYPEFIHELRDESGLRIDFREDGTILFPASDQSGNGPILMRTNCFLSLERLGARARTFRLARVLPSRAMRRPPRLGCGMCQGGTTPRDRFFFGRRGEGHYYFRWTGLRRHHESNGLCFGLCGQLRGSMGGAACPTVISYSSG